MIICRLLEARASSLLSISFWRLKPPHSSNPYGGLSLLTIISLQKDHDNNEEDRASLFTFSLLETLETILYSSLESGKEATLSSELESRVDYVCSPTSLVKRQNLKKKNLKILSTTVSKKKLEIDYKNLEISEICTDEKS